MSNNTESVVKPIAIAFFLAAILLVLLGFTFLSESGAIVKPNKVEDGIVLSELDLKYPTFQSFFYKKKDSLATEADIAEITSAVVPVEDIPEPIVSEDSIRKTETLQLLDLTQLDTTKVVRIRYPDSTGDFLHQLKTNLESGSCRIFHYGDSQIEGDRITAYVRNRLQGMYGGSGPGFMPIKQVYEQISAEVEVSENWLRYAFFDPKKDRLEHRKYGTFLSLSRFTPAIDSLPPMIVLDSMPIQQASIRVAPTKLYYNRLKSYKTVGLHYGNVLYPTSIEILEDGVVILKDSLNADGNYHYLPIALSKVGAEISINLEGKISPDFYGLTLDGDNGIQIDNVAMRGSSGTVFRGLNADNYSRMSRVLKPKLVVMQYGGNNVPYLKDSTGVDNYCRYMKGHINWLKARNKDAQVLFIGPTDMVTAVNGEMTTYELLPYLNNKLQETCLGNDVAYWNMFEAMGGKGAMPIWVEQKLAGNDYTHFTPKGTKIISELFFVSLYLDLISDKQ